MEKLSLLYLKSDYLDEAVFQEIWKEVTRRNIELHKIAAEEVLYDIMEERTAISLKDYRIVHNAFYCGDYKVDKTIDAFFDYLSTNSEVEKVEYGPSYISPKEYNTPGWWFSVRTKSGFEIELFSCRYFDKWKSYDISRKNRLMSHVALCFQRTEDFYSVMKVMNTKIKLRRIMLTENDVIGHTYAHYINEETEHVVELMFENKGGEHDYKADE